MTSPTRELGGEGWLHADLTGHPDGLSVDELADVLGELPGSIRSWSAGFPMQSRTFVR
jgi:hypothetical protein